MKLEFVIQLLAASEPSEVQTTQAGGHGNERRLLLNEPLSTVYEICSIIDKKSCVEVLFNQFFTQFYQHIILTKCRLTQCAKTAMSFTFFTQVFVIGYGIIYLAPRSENSVPVHLVTNFSYWQ